VSADKIPGIISKEQKFFKFFFKMGESTPFQEPKYRGSFDQDSGNHVDYQG
jgi:hypothetical protein